MPRKFTLYILLLISSTSIAQELWIGNYYLFQSILIYKDPTAIEENLLRKKLKIKSIKKETIIPESENILNINQRIDSNQFKKYLRNHEMLHYPKVEQFDFSDNGIIMNYKNYPISDYLTEQDLVYCNDVVYNFRVNGKSEILENWVSDKLVSKYFYENGLLNKTIKSGDTTEYSYDKNKKLIQVVKSGKKIYKGIYNKRHITHYFEYLDSIYMIQKSYIMEVELNRQKQMISSYINEKKSPDIRIYHKVVRDSYGNTIKILESYYSDFKNSGEIIVLNNEYNEGYLSAITEYQNDKSNWVKYFFQSGIMIKKEYSWGVTIKYSYTYY